MAILYGEAQSTHWIFGHLEAGKGFPYRSVLADEGLSGQLSLVLMGGNLTREIDEHRRNQLQAIEEQMSSIGFQLAHVHTYWNDVSRSHIDVVARVSTTGLSRVHVLLVPNGRGF